MDCKTLDPVAIELSRTGYFSPLILDYLAEQEQIKPFTGHPPLLASFAKQIHEKSSPYLNREVLSEVLLAQYGTLLDPALRESIGSLRNASTYTVTTGHQLNIFGGPLYFVYKIISTINLARAVEKANPGVKVVPLFWMATEDHDFEEISHVQLFGKRLKWAGEPKGATGRMPGEGPSALLGELKSILGDSERAEELTVLFEKAYSAPNSLAQATRYFVHQLFGKHGLLVIDGDDARLKSCFSAVMKRDILEGLSNSHVNATNALLEEAGYKAQAHSREINFFYLEEGARERIVLEDGEYRVLNTSLKFSPSGLEEAIAAHPERFSPNVLMRPLYQEAILPNLAYIGGSGELAYWMQLKSTFEAHGLQFPILMLRNSALMLDEISERKLETLKLDPAELFREEEQLVADYVKSHSAAPLSFEEEQAAFERIFEVIARKAAALDPTLKDSAEAEKARFFNSLKGLEHKLSKAAKRKFDTELTQLRRLRQKLFPDGGLQERTENFMPFYLKYGEEWILLLMDRFDPFLNKFQILSLSHLANGLRNP